MKLPVFLALGLFSLTACAQSGSPSAATTPGAQGGAAHAAKPGAGGLATQPAAGTPEARAIDALRQINPGLVIDHVGTSPIAGFTQVVVGGQVLYVSADGKYLLQGAMFDVAAKKDVGEAALAQVRGALLKTIPVSDRIVFAAPNPKHTVLVFTDVECGYCRKLHSQIADYNEAGITVEYLAFPRAGIGSPDYEEMVSVWCASDRQKALTDAKNGRPVPKRSCANPVAAEHQLGQRVGLDGTPMILTEDGALLGGYLPPDRLRLALDQLHAEPAPVAGNATGSL